MTKPSLFIFLGRSGCGKGTQTTLLSKHLKDKNPETGVFYVSTGDEFRKFLESDSYTSIQLKKIISAGGLAPSFLASMMWANVIAKEYTENTHMIVDGSPRTLAEKEIFDTIFDFYGMQHVYEFEKVHIVYMDVSREWGTQRLLGRARSDDTVEAVARRMDWFDKYLYPVILKYKTDPRVVFHNVNGEKSIEEVHEEIVKSLEI